MNRNTPTDLPGNIKTDSSATGTTPEPTVPTPGTDRSRSRREHTQLQWAYHADDIDEIRKLVANGADTAELGWTDIFHAVVFGNSKELKKAIHSGYDRQHRDCLGRTPLMLAILAEDTNKARRLIETHSGGDTNAVDHKGNYPSSYAIMRDNVDILELLLDNGFHHEQRDPEEETPLMIAAKHGAIKCLKALIARGADVSAENPNPYARAMYWDDLDDADERVEITAIKYASNPEIVAALMEAGANFNHLRRTMRAVVLGYRTLEDPVYLTLTPTYSREDFKKYKCAQFGKSNPELATNSYWQTMVRCSCEPESVLGGNQKHRPRWTYHRAFSAGPITPLPDGRYVEIGGTYIAYAGSRNNWTYNDVIVHDGKGDCDIYIYPREAFPPLYGHTATLVNQHIYIIGEDTASENESDIKLSDYIQVFRLDMATMKIERIETSGDIPGRIAEHDACYDGESKITIQKVDYVDNSKKHQGRYERANYGNEHRYTLCLKSMQWRKPT